MNAVEFVRNYGWDVSRQNVGHTDDVLFFQYGNCVISCNDLKRLVGSYELVESYGGLDSAKLHICFRKEFKLYCLQNLVKPIADVEKCQ